MIQYYVINWDVNTDKLEYYDIMPYLYSEFKKSKMKKKDLTLRSLEEFIKKVSMYMYWSRCEYEVIVTNFPSGKNSHKLDIYQQIEMNLSNIAKLMYDDLMSKKKSK